MTDKAFWDEKVAVKDKPFSVRVNGSHFIIGPEGEKYPGFGGQKFHIKFHDGREVITTNLWHQGKIPVSYRFRKTKLPDNAVFIHPTNCGCGRKECK